MSETSLISTPDQRLRVFVSSTMEELATERQAVRAMKGDMTGWFEVRVDGPRRHHYRLFCRLDYDARDRSKPLLVVICGLDKPFRTQLSDADYRQVRDLGAEYLRQNPRSLA